MHVSQFCEVTLRSAFVSMLVSQASYHSLTPPKIPVLPRYKFRWWKPLERIRIEDISPSALEMGNEHETICGACDRDGRQVRAVEAGALEKRGWYFVSGLLDWFIHNLRDCDMRFNWLVAYFILLVWVDCSNYFRFIHWRPCRLILITFVKRE